MKPLRARVKQKIINGVRTFLICVVISLIIYMVVVVENSYQNLLTENADSYTVIFWIFFVGFLIFLVVESSPLFHKLFFRMFGADEPEAKGKNSQ